MTYAWFAVGVLVGALIAWLVLRARSTELRARLEAEEKGSSEKVALVQSTEEKFEERLRALALKALDDNSDRFLGLAELRVAPLAESLTKLDETIRLLEQARGQSGTDVRTALELLSRETKSLSRALRTPDTVGSWGQVQLRRVVEMAGMLDHCDFDEQQTHVGDDGQRQRPDVTIHLPNGAHIAIDAKVPRSAFLDAERADDEQERERHLVRHAQLVRAHLRSLGAKEYQKQFVASPECVVMFVPHEPFISAACLKDPALIEEGFAQDKVMVATPLTLIALLLGFATGWRQVKAAEHAELVVARGRELYDRVGKLAEHFRELRKHLNGAVVSYNATAGSLETRFLPEARKFPTLLSISESDEVSEPLKPIEEVARDLHAPELAVPSTEPEQPE